MRSASQFRINLRALPRCVTWCATFTAMTRAKRVILRNLAAHPIAFVERCTQGFAETPISSVPVCLGQAKLSLKSGLAEVNIVHLDSGHGGGFDDSKDQAPRGKKKNNDYRPSKVKESSDTASWGTSCLSPGCYPDAAGYPIMTTMAEQAIQYFQVGGTKRTSNLIRMDK
jgi:hypothetical protein